MESFRRALVLALLVPGAALARADGGAPFPALDLAARARGISVPAAPSLPTVALPQAVDAFYTRVAGVTLSDETRTATLRSLGRLSPTYRGALARLLSAVTAAQQLRNAAFAGISPADIAHAHRVALRTQDAPASVTAADATRALVTIGRIDMATMVQAASLVRSVSAQVLPALTAADAPRARIETPFDAVVIGTADDDLYTRDVQVLIDPAGNDRYVNNAGGVLNQQAFDTTGGCVLGGGSTGAASPNLACSPAPSSVCTWDVANNATGRDDLEPVGVPGHDRPGTGNGRDGSCGNDARRAALLSHTAHIADDGDSRGVAVLLDAGGSDTYTAPWSYEDPLFDLIAFCHPDDRSKMNTNRDLFQGSALAGVSVLWDAGPGDNTYRGRLNAQGSGHVGGIGMLLSTGGGDDRYWADRLSQGNGIAGGIGVLHDDGGANEYLLEPPVVYRNEFRPNARDCTQEGRAGQGQGGFLGVGVLWNEGAGTYRAVTHLTAPGAPFDPLLDGDGRARLVRGTDAQGSGESFPIPGTPGGIVLGAGILVDAGGSAGVCSGAGKIDGASHVTRAPGAIDRSCGAFNVPAELDAGDLPAALQHLAGGAVGLRVIR